MSSFKRNCLPSRRSVLAGLAAAAAWGKQAFAQDMPEAAQGLVQLTPVPAPPFRFTDAAGRPLTLANYAGAGLVINVWATWCPPCVEEFPSLDALAAKLAGDKILVLPISQDYEALKVVQPFYSSRGIRHLPILLDPEGNAGDLLDGPGIPETVIITPSGQMVARVIGGADWNNEDTLTLVRRLAGTRRASSGVQPV